jgi:hypothetical protein
LQKKNKEKKPGKKNKEKKQEKKKQEKKNKRKKKSMDEIDEKKISSSPSPPPSDSEQEIKIAIRKKKKIADLLSSESSSLWETQLNRYYELKQEYEKQERIFFLQKKEKEEGEEEDNDDRRRPLCIQCQRPVGTIFGRKYNDRKKCPMVFASCGDRKQPCTLKIIIFTGRFINIFTKLQELQTQIAEQKNQIIEWKNNVLFGYETEETILDRFENSKKSIAELNFALNKFYTLVYKLSYNNREWQKKCSNLKEAIDAIIFEIQQLQPSDENGSRKLCDAYQRLEPLFRELRDLKYAVCHVEKTSNTEYELVQQKNAIQQYYTEETPPMVQSFHYYPKNGKKRQQQLQQENTVAYLTTTEKNYLKKKNNNNKRIPPRSFTINVDAF